MANIVQFIGKDAVMQAFSNRDVEAWSIFLYKQFIHKGVGAGDLHAFLSMIEGGSNAIYTLKVYEDIEDAKKIKEKTEADGSYNFRLDGEGMSVGAFQQSKLLFDKQASDRLKLIEDKLNEEPEEEEETIGSIVSNIIRDPVKTMQWVEIIKYIFSPGTATANAEPFKQIAQMGNTVPPTNDDKLDRIEAALDTLGRNDAKICEHLEKLAQISVKNPSKFKMLLSALENS